MTENDKKRYIAFKERARKIGRISVYALSICFVLLVASAILAEKVWRPVLPIATGVFVIFSACFVFYVLRLNASIKKIEKECEYNSDKDE